MTQTKKVDLQALEERLRLARVALTAPSMFPYYYPLAFSLAMKPSWEVSTMEIDGRLVLKYNPAWTAERTDQELVGLLWHELNHVLRDHTGPRGVALMKWLLEAMQDEEIEKFDPGKWLEESVAVGPALLVTLAADLANVAEDAEINDDAQEARVVLPEGGVFPEVLGLPKGLHAEKYAEALVKKLKEELEKLQGGGGEGNGGEGSGKEEAQSSQRGGRGQEGSSDREGSSGGQESSSGQKDSSGGRGGSSILDLLKKLVRDVRPGKGSGEGEEEGLDPSMVEVLKRQTAELIVEAATKGRGKVPAGILRAAKEILEPKANWRSLLRQEIRKGILDFSQKRRYTYNRPHRRQGAAKDVILPGKYGLKPQVAVVVDTSGSMGEKELSRALAEVKGILQATGPGRKPTVYSVDAQVHAAQKIFRLEDIKLLGGGGTDMGLGVVRALEDGHDVVVVVTDGYTPWPEKHPRPGAKVVVALVGDPGENWPTPSWAKVVRVED